LVKSWRSTNSAMTCPGDSGGIIRAIISDNEQSVAGI
jgi:hypothetical protein